MDAIKEIGARVAPKPERSNSNRDEKPQIVINIGKVEAAIKRQEVLEVEALNGTK